MIETDIRPPIEPIEKVFIVTESPSVPEAPSVAQKNLKDYLRIIEPYLAMSTGAIAALGAILGTRT